MINQQELDYLYDEIDLWIQNDEDYYNEFNKIKYSSYRIYLLVRNIIRNHDFSEYKTSIMYVRKVVRKLKEEYKNE